MTTFICGKDSSHPYQLANTRGQSNISNPEYLRCWSCGEGGCSFIADSSGSNQSFYESSKLCGISGGGTPATCVTNVPVGRSPLPIIQPPVLAAKSTGKPLPQELPLPDEIPLPQNISAQEIPAQQLHYLQTSDQQVKKHARCSTAIIVIIVIFIALVIIAGITYVYIKQAPKKQTYKYLFNLPAANRYKSISSTTIF
jgi:hypothetical protein